MIMALVMTVAVMPVHRLVKNSYFRIDIFRNSIWRTLYFKLCVCVYNFSFYEKVEPFPRIMTLDMVGPMVTLSCFKATLCFKWKVIFGIENFKYAN